MGSSWQHSFCGVRNGEAQQHQKGTAVFRVLPAFYGINRCLKEVDNSLRLAVFLMCRDFCNNGPGYNEIGPLLSIFLPLMSLEAPGCAKGEGRGLATSSLLNKM